MLANAVCDCGDLCSRPNTNYFYKNRLVGTFRATYCLLLIKWDSFSSLPRIRYFWCLSIDVRCMLQILSGLHLGSGDSFASVCTCVCDRNATKSRNAWFVYYYTSSFYAGDELQRSSNIESTLHSIKSNNSVIVLCMCELDTDLCKTIGTFVHSISGRHIVSYAYASRSQIVTASCLYAGMVIQCHVLFKVVAFCTLRILWRCLA